MKKLILGAAAALCFAAPAPALAQSAILVVDTDRVVTECNACRTANAQINAQVQQLQQRQQQLGGPLQTEGQQIQTAVNALNGRQPDAALQQRIQGFQNRQNAAAQEVARLQQNIRSVEAHVNQQIATRLGPILQQVLSTRRASVMLARNATLANAPNTDVTGEVLAQLNRTLTAISVTPLPQQQQQQPRRQ